MLRLSQKYIQKKAFITGAGGGLGKELALLLAADDWTIGITDINNSLIESALQEINTTGGKGFGYCFNVGDKFEFEKAIQDFIHQNHEIDLFINNAGVGDGGLFGDYSLENWDWIVNINQMGVIYGCHLVLPIMKKQGFGHILNIASAAGYANMPNMSMYNVTKAAIISLSETLYAELKPFGINISVVMPTFFRSNVMQYNRGPEEATTVGKALSQKAKILPKEVALKILTDAGKEKFHIFHPFQATVIWYLKRFFPSLFLSLKLWGFKKKKWVIQRILEKK